MNAIKSIENVFFANARYWGGLNSSLYHRGSLWAMHTGIKSADLNLVWNETPLTDSKKIPDIKNLFRKADLPFCWWVFPSGKSLGTADALQAEGFSLLASVPCMLADLTMLSADRSNASLQIKQVSNQEELLLWEDVSFSGFDFHTKTRQQYQRFVSTFNLNPDSPQKFFLAFLHGKAVATSLLFLQERVGGIYFVSTLAEYRRRGIGLSLTHATMRYAKQAGARLATLQSSTDGLRVYQQAGFQEYCRADVYSLKN